MEAVDQDPRAAKDFILSGLPKALEPVSDTVFSFRFLSSPCRILGDENGKVTGLEVEDTKLVLVDGVTKARGLDTRQVLDVDTVIFCIGDKVDDKFGLPIQWNEFVKNPNPQYPIDDISFEAFDPETETPIEGVFVAGWSREASNGLVGVARKDGIKGAHATSKYLENVPAQSDPSKIIAELKQVLEQREEPFVTKDDVTRLEEIERAEAEKQGLETYKMKTNQEMLDSLGSL
jgi:ferredoxin--NADP+ reductase